MLKSKTPVIVGLSVFDSEYLKLSVTGLGRLRKNFRLIIHNNNPEQKITTRQIRRLRYRGKLSIINSGTNVGQMGARMMILNHIKLKKFVAPWIMMINQTDIPTQIVVPNVAPDKFAIIQNRTVIKSGLGNVLTAIRDPKQCKPDGKDVILEQPYIGLTGTLIKTDVMMHLGDVIREHIDAISDVIATTNNTNVVDDMMWTGVNIVARHDNKNANPIYMDCVNCVTVATDTPTTSKTIITQNAKLVAKFGRIVQTALNIAADAAPTGQNMGA